MLPWSSNPFTPSDPSQQTPKKNIHQAAIAPKTSRRLRSGSVGISQTRFNIFPVGFWKEKKTHRLPGHMQQQAGGKWEKCPHGCLCMYTRTARDVAVFCRRVEIRLIPSSKQGM